MKLIRLKPTIPQNTIYLEDAHKDHIDDKIIIGVNTQDAWMNLVQKNNIEKYYFLKSCFVKDTFSSDVHYSSIDELIEKNEKDMNFYIYKELTDLAQDIIENSWL